MAAFVSSPALAQTDPANMELDHTHGTSVLDGQVADLQSQVDTLQSALANALTEGDQDRAIMIEAFTKALCAWAPGRLDPGHCVP